MIAPAFFSQFDRQTMARALQLAELGLNSTTPNPRVGCVICKGGVVLAEGYHRAAGEPHAEVNALNAATASVEGADVYVTLEPCSHHGKTGPCAEALIETKVARVVYAMEDPNPAVAGRGITMMRDAGISVEGPLMEDSARALNPGFIKRMTQGVPFVRCKMAMSLDGRTAMASGESKWITGPAARQDVQRLRAQSCALVTGVDSVIADDPALTVRQGDDDRQPLRVILDTHGRCPERADILSQAGRSVIATAASSDTAKRECWTFPLVAGRIDLRALMKRLAQESCNEVLVETGATLSGAFVAAGLVDEFIIYVAPKLMGSSARPLFSLPIDKMNGQLPLKISDVRAVGEDWRIVATPDPEG